MHILIKNDVYAGHFPRGQIKIKNKNHRDDDNNNILIYYLPI